MLTVEVFGFTWYGLDAEKKVAMISILFILQTTQSERESFEIERHKKYSGTFIIDFAFFFYKFT